MNTSKADRRVSVVVCARNAWEHTSRCLAALRTTLRPDDEVIVVDDGSTDLTAAMLATYPWARVHTNLERRGVAAARNQGAMLATGDVIVFLDNDTVVADGWLEELLGPFGDPMVAAVGPRLSNVPGAQLVEDVGCDGSSLSALDEFATAWRATHQGRTEQAARLGGVCLAVRAADFRSAGGFDEGYETREAEDDDLAMKLRRLGRRLVLAHGSFVHHGASACVDAGDAEDPAKHDADRGRFRDRWGSDVVAPLMLLSACLIVKDEEAMLGECLDSLAGVVDEIIVYDTGSTDATVALARAKGARVVEGYWDDSFARARNAALAEATGEWVLSLDADERFLGDAASLRHFLASTEPAVEAFLIPIENLQGAGNTRSVHTATRLFRRSRVTWRHRLHEQVGPVDDAGGLLNFGYVSGLRIIHYGYRRDVFDAKGKAARNVALAESALEDPDIDPAYALMNYGRSLGLVGRLEEAAAALTESVELETVPPTKRLALKNLIHTLGALGRYDEALERVNELRRVSVSQIDADIVEGGLLISRGDARAGLVLLSRVPPRGRDDDGNEYSAHTLSAMRAEALASIGMPSEAANVVLDAIRHEGVFEVDLAELVGWLADAHRRSLEIIDVLEVDDLMAFLGRLLRLEPSLGDELLEGVWSRFPDRLEVLAAAGRLAPRVTVARALVWSSRLRKRGLAEQCPLVAMTRDERREPRERILAGAAAFGAFAEEQVLDPVRSVRAALDASTRRDADEEIARLAPALLSALDRSDDPSRAAPPADGPPRLATDVGGSVPHAGETSGSLAGASALRSSYSRRAVATTKYAPRPRPGGVNLVGPFESLGVYGVVARSLSTLLARHGVAVSTSSYNGSGRAGRVGFAHRGPRDHPFDTTVLVMAPEDLVNFVMDEGVEPFTQRYMIGAWLWDFEDPSEVLEQATSTVHELWVPSSFTAGALGQVTSKPVTVFPLAAAGTSLRHRDAPRGAEDVSFLSVVDYESNFERQNPLGVVEAFRLAFRPGEGPHLFVHAINAERYPVEHALLLDAARGHDVSVLSDEEVGAEPFSSRFEPTTSCYVSLHRSDGTGLALASAMLDGVVAIVTDHSFGAEFMSDREGFLVPWSYEVIGSSMSGRLREGRWARPDLTSAALAMRTVVDEPQLARVKARRARERARRQLSPSRAARDMIERLRAIERLRGADAPRALAGTSPTNSLD